MTNMVLFFARDDAMFLFLSDDGVMDRKCVMCEKWSNVNLSRPPVTPGDPGG